MIEVSRKALIVCLLVLLSSCGGDEEEEEPVSAEILTDAISFGSGLEKSSFDILNSGSSSFNWEIYEDIDWLAVEPTAGVTEPGRTTSITLTVDRSRLHKLMDEELVEIRIMRPGLSALLERISVSIAKDVSSSFYPLPVGANWTYRPEKPTFIAEVGGEEITLHMSPIERHTESPGWLTAVWSAWCRIEGSKVSYDLRYQLAFLEQDGGLYCSSEELEMDIIFEGELGTFRTTAVGTFDPPFRVFDDVSHIEVGQNIQVETTENMIVIVNIPGFPVQKETVVDRVTAETMVLGKERVTTAAGTFDTLKIFRVIAGDELGTIMSSHSWICRGIGEVQYENEMSEVDSEPQLVFLSRSNLLESESRVVLDSPPKSKESEIFPRPDRSLKGSSIPPMEKVKSLAKLCFVYSGYGLSMRIPEGLSSFLHSGQ